MLRLVRLRLLFTSNRDFETFLPAHLAAVGSVSLATRASVQRGSALQSAQWDDCGFHWEFQVFLLLKSFLPLFCDKDCIGDVLKATPLELLSE